MEKIFISKNRLIISIIFFGTNTIIFVFYLKELFFNPHLIKYLTFLSYYANSIFLFLCLLCDILLYIKNPSSDDEQMEKDYNLITDNDTKENNYEITWIEHLNNWNRNKYGIICNSFSFFVSISFWILFFLGEEYIRVSNTFYAFLSTVNLHLIISIFVIIDIFISKREHKFSNEYFCIILTLFLIYSVVTGINKYVFNVNPYAFMNGSFIFLIGYLLLSVFILYISYWLNVYLINLKKNDSYGIKVE